MEKSKEANLHVIQFNAVKGKTNGNSSKLEEITGKNED